MNGQSLIVPSVLKKGKKVSNRVVSQALKGFGCKLSKVMSVTSRICRQNRSGAKLSHIKKHCEEIEN